MSKAEREEILLLEWRQARAINKNNIRAAIKMFDEGFVGFSSTRHKRIRGLAALAKTFRYYLKSAPKMTYRIQQPQVQVNGGVAVATFYWEVGLGRGRKIHGRGTHVFVRRGEDWRIIHEHFSRAH